MEVKNVIHSEERHRKIQKEEWGIGRKMRAGQKQKLDGEVRVGKIGRISKRMRKGRRMRD